MIEGEDSRNNLRIDQEQHLKKAYLSFRKMGAGELLGLGAV